MTALALLPPILCLIILGAHCIRLGTPWLLVVPLAGLLLLCWPRPWAARLNQVILMLGALEWIRVTLIYIGSRMQLGIPWLRLALILGGVVLLTLASALLFETRPLRRRYGLASV